ncbi:hypothetical protein Ocin01_06892 [Orchesella cincta]|uniref:Interferon alpha-inducible protein 27, mitochondrial n=1 Tax=Orchesella cincta TaxID=48709 RepID=A0A1D2N4C9_ORCCI|nr:hypothetical protein Ocin01_06892 [Orchesella cincta]
MVANGSRIKIIIILAIATTILPTSNGLFLEAIGFTASGIAKGSVVAWLQSAGALGTSYFTPVLGAVGFTATGIAKGSFAAMMQSAAMTGAGMLGGAASFSPVGMIGGALASGAAGAAYYLNTTTLYNQTYNLYSFYTG